MAGETGRRAVTVLYIDDDPATRFLFRELLQEAEPGDRAEVQWLEAGDIEEAIQRYGAARADVVLLDNRLGGEDGVDLLPRVRQTWNCPVWMLTGVCTERLVERSRRNGAHGVISKDEMISHPGRIRSTLLQTLSARGG